MGWRAGLGRASGAEPPSLRSSGAHSAALPDFRDSGTLKVRMRCQMPASWAASGHAGAEPRGENAGAGAAGRIFRSPCAVPGAPQGDSVRPAVHTCLFLPGHHVPFTHTHRPLASGRSRSRRLPEQGGSVCLWQFFPRCGILPHCFSGETVHCPAVPVPFRREEKFRCQISPSSLSLPRWTGCLTRRCARS